MLLNVGRYPSTGVGVGVGVIIGVVVVGVGVVDVVLIVVEVVLCVEVVWGGLCGGGLGHWMAYGKNLRISQII